MKTWAKTKVQGPLRHQSGKYYARLYLAGKEKWLCLDTTLLEVAKAKLKNERETLAKASKTGWGLRSVVVAAVAGYILVGLRSS